MSELLISNPNGFNYGLNSITKINEQTHDTGIHFAILKLKQGDEYCIHSRYESAYLLMHGEAEFVYDKKNIKVSRTSLFDEDPYALHLPQSYQAKIIAHSDCELSVQEVINHTEFEPMFFDCNNLLESENRGQGLLGDTAHRIVRTIFDIRNRPEAKLVLGEVITFPGRWSSYPPHHHRQPEIYHYRFTEPQGYGHGESGDTILKIRENDTLKILYELDHGHVAAPGYGMYYIWVIRHLENDPYTIPDFTKEHAWTKSSEANSRVWSANNHD